MTLKEGTHYTLSYKNNVNAGTAQVTVSGKGSLEGAVTKSFTIAKADISKASISASGTYAPDDVKIGINAKFGNYTLKSSDYSLAGDHRGLSDALPQREDLACRSDRTSQPKNGRKHG